MRERIEGYFYIPVASRVADPVRLWRCESVVDGCGLTFIALQNEHANALKINPHRQLRFNKKLRADWAATRRAVAQSALAASIAIVPIAD